MKLLFLLLTPFTLVADEIITIEHATTREALCQGLMMRDHLEPNHGMLFHYPRKGKHRVWMYNCLIPLSIAFLDENGVILEIHELEAHPGLSDREQFLKESVVSEHPAKFSLEMEAEWFQNHGVSIGDRIEWDFPSAKANVILRK